MLMDSQSSGKSYNFNSISIEHLDGEQGYRLQYDVKITEDNMEQKIVSSITNYHIPLEFQQMTFPANNTAELMRQFILQCYFEFQQITFLANNTEELTRQFILYFERKEIDVIRAIERARLEREILNMFVGNNRNNRIEVAQV